jgi:ribosomal protein L37AE/L43A
MEDNMKNDECPHCKKKGTLIMIQPGVVTCCKCGKVFNYVAGKMQLIKV